MARLALGLFIAGAYGVPALVRWVRGAGRAAPDYRYRHVGPPVEERCLPADMFDRGILEPKMAPADVPRLADLIAGRKRIWLVYSHHWYTDPQGIITRYLDATLDKQAERAFNGLNILLYNL
jgi:hypothetical protein